MVGLGPHYRGTLFHQLWHFIMIHSALIFGHHSETVPSSIFSYHIRSYEALYISRAAITQVLLALIATLALRQRPEGIL